MRPDDLFQWLRATPFLPFRIHNAYFSN